MNITTTRPTHDGLHIRPASEADLPALRRLAHLDDRRLPSGELVLAEEGGEIRAAVATQSGSAIADPWRPTARIVDALRAWSTVSPV
jgi:hypothetical protein